MLLVLMKLTFVKTEKHARIFWIANWERCVTVYSHFQESERKLSNTGWPNFRSMIYSLDTNEIAFDNKK